MRLLALVVAFAASTTSPALATDATTQSALEAWQADPTVIFDASEVSLDEFMWIARPLIVFADTKADPAFQRQVEFLTDRVDELVDRDVVMIVDSSRAEPSDIRRKLRPRGFQLTLIGKDGAVFLRKPFPWSVREISRSIDKLPMRQQELSERRQTE